MEGEDASLESPEKRAKTSASADKKIPDFEPPLASVQRIVKNALPDNCQITKESKSAFAKAAGIFVLYLTSCSNDFCAENKRSTIASADVIAAIKELEFDDILGQLEDFLIEYRKEASAKKTSVQQQNGSEMTALEAD